MVTSDLFASAYVSGFPGTVRLLLSKGVSPADAEEYAQHAWVRGWEALDQLREEGRVAQWVNAIAMNFLAQARRRGKRVADFDESRHRAVPPPAVASKVDAETLLERCSRSDRSLLAQRYRDGMTTAEIAAERAMTAGAVRVRIHRARAALRRFVQSAPSARAAAP